MTTRRSVLACLIAMPVVSAGCGSGSTIDPAAAWRTPGAGETDPRRYALAHAILAPNPHNRQPWLIDLAGNDEVLFYPDTARLLPATDPPNRQITLGCGAFLELFDLAVRQVGRRADITLWPEGEPHPRLDNRPIARIRLVSDRNITRDALFEQITNRHTNRAPYDLKAPPTAAELAAILAAADGGGITAGTISDEATRVQIMQLAWQGWTIESHTPATHMESVRLIRIGAAEIAAHRDGISLSGPMLEILKAGGVLTPATLADPDSFAAKSSNDMARKALDATPAFFWLKGANNSRATQIAAGRAYARAHLTATRLGLNFQPWSMTLQEYQEMAGPYAATQVLLGAGPEAPLQMLVRVGRAKASPPAPRRGLAAHIRT
ncbi:Acg family FMN-binding oxidoreductase [Caulobacter sp. DWR3-1-2]|uniref:Acg family FMN-binding oxidoreductase n=1 Tax=Caulobacter sp. DWR3-1-2 TaxID=2804647 RepID=UPI003CF369A4